MDEKLKDFVYRALKTGKSLSSKRKDRKKDSTIISYDGPDAFYSDEEKSDAAPEKDVTVEAPVRIEHYARKKERAQSSLQTAPQSPQSQNNDNICEEEKSPLRAVVENVKEKIPGFSDTDVPQEEILFDEDARQFESENEEAIEEEEELAQDAFLYYQGLSEKIENLKQNLFDKLNERLKKEKDGAIAEKLDSLPAQLDALQADQLKHIQEILEEQKALFQEIFTQSGNRFKEILNENAQRLEKTATELEQAVSAFDSCAQTRLDSLSDSMTSLYDAVRDINSFVSSINSLQLQMGEKIDAVYTNVAGITKLNDSVFELKSANVDLKNAVEQISGSYKSLKQKCTIGFIILGVLSLAGIALQIMQLVA